MNEQGRTSRGGASSLGGRTIYVIHLRSLSRIPMIKSILKRIETLEANSHPPRDFFVICPICFEKSSEKKERCKPCAGTGQLEVLCK